MLWLVETMLWLMGGFWGICSVSLFSVDTPDGGIVTFLLMVLAFVLGSKVHRKRKAKKEAKRAEKKVENFLSPVAEIDRLRAEMAVLQAETEMELERAKVKLAQEKRKKEGRRVQCPNCCGTSMVFGRYGTCDYCDSPLTVTPTTDNVVAEFVDLEIKAIRRRDEMSALKADILRVLRRTELCTVSEIANQLREPVPVQKVYAVLRTMMDEGTVDRMEIRKKAVFYAKGA